MKINSSKKYPLSPRPKPAIGPSKWSKVAKRYYRFRDNVKRLGMRLTMGATWVTFRVPMPPSWPEKRKLATEGTPHQQKPDLDNLMKALGDAIYSDDSGIWRI